MKKLSLYITIFVISCNNPKNDINLSESNKLDTFYEYEGDPFNGEGGYEGEWGEKEWKEYDSIVNSIYKKQIEEEKQLNKKSN
jgi:hypothetical protein